MLGKRFGRLVVKDMLRRHPRIKSEKIYRCVCDCGVTCEARGTSLRKGERKSCGCLYAQTHKPKWLDAQLGELRVVAYDSAAGYLCECCCGASKRFTARELRDKVKHGTEHCGAAGHYPAALSHLPAYRLWAGIKSRVTHNPTYVRRGIKLCPEWYDFAAFEAYMVAVLGDRPSLEWSLDRIDNDAGYEPGNVRWATAHMQANNTSRNVPTEYMGVVYQSRSLARGAWEADGCPDIAPFYTLPAGARARRRAAALLQIMRAAAVSSVTASDDALFERVELALGVWPSSPYSRYRLFTCIWSAILPTDGLVATKIGPKRAICLT